jgi:hypothetical protein
MSNRVFLFVLLAALFVPATGAQAATRYAAPAGVASPDCLQATPCDIETAIDSASGGDEVILLGGTYNIAPLSGIGNAVGDSTPAGVTIRGESVAAPPLIRSSPTADYVVGLQVNYGVTLRDVRLSFEGPNAVGIALYTGQQSTIERVQVDAGAKGINACVIAADGTIKNSVCVARADGASALSWSLGMSFASPNVFDFSATVRNSVFASRGANGYGVILSDNNGNNGLLSIQLQAFNSVFSATGVGGTDVATDASTPTATAAVAAQYSNYSSVNTTGTGTNFITAVGNSGNQTAEPVFVNPSGGDFRQLPESPTIDAGSNDPANGTIDLAGQPRTVGAFTDIGAYEMQPDPVVPFDLSSLSLKPTKFRAALRGSTLRPASTFPKKKRGQSQVGSLLNVTSTDAGKARLYVFQKLT